MAQSRPEDGIDFLRAQSDAAQGTSLAPLSAAPPTFGSLTSGGPGASLAPAFSFNVSGPLTFDRLISQSKGNNSEGEGGPEIKLAGSQQPPGFPLKLSGYVDALADRFIGTSSDGDTLSGQLRADWIGTSDHPNRYAPIPYASYTPQRFMMPTFGHQTKFVQDFAVGGSELWDYYANGKPLEGTVGGTFKWEFGLQGYYQHRVVDKPPNSDALSISPSVKYAVNSQLAASMQISIARRWYAQSAGVAERVWTEQPIATVSYLLPDSWFGSLGAEAFGKPQLAFQVAYANQDSTVAANTSHKLSVGPLMNVAWTF